MREDEASLRGGTLLSRQIHLQQVPSKRSVRCDQRHGEWNCHSMADRRRSYPVTLPDGRPGVHYEYAKAPTLSRRHRGQIPLYVRP